ncbi:MAG: hypothetical protein AAF490_24455 [Chloroflexota bacterium]
MNSRFVLIFFFVLLLIGCTLAQPVTPTPISAVNPSPTATAVAVQPTPTVQPTETLPPLPEPTHTAVPTEPIVPTEPPLPTETAVILPTAIVTLPSTSTPTPASLPTIPTTSNLNYSTIVQFGGTPNSIELDGQIAYLGVGPRVAAIDVSNPSNPALLWQTGLLAGQVEDINRDPNTGFLYVAAGTGGVNVINPTLATPNRIVYQGPDYGGEQPIYASQIYVHNQTAYVLDSEHFDGSLELLRFNLTTPDTPQFVDAISLPPFGHISPWNEYIFVPHRNGIDILDLNSDLQQIASIPIGADQYNPRIQMLGSLAFVSTDNNGGFVRAYDLSDPHNPNLKFSHKLSDTFNVNTLAVSETRLVQGQIFGEFGYCASTLFISNIEDPENLQSTANFDPQNCLHDMVISGNTLFAVGLSGFMIYDLTDAENPTRQSHFVMPSGLQDVQAAAQQDQYVYVLSNEGRGHVLKTLDMANPTSPVLGDPVALENGSPVDLFIQNNLLFIPVWMEGFWIFDIQNPAAPQLLSTPQQVLGISTGHRTFELFNNFAVTAKYTNNLTGGLAIIEFTDPSNPTEVAIFETGHYQINDLAQSGNLLFVLNKESESFLSIFDLSDPTNPIKLSETLMPYNFGYIHFQDGVLYSWCEGWDCQEIGQLDVSDPANPQFVQGWQLPINVQQFISLDANRFIVTSYDDGIWELDFTDRTAPILNGRFSHAIQGFGVKLTQPDSNVLTVPATGGGFHLLRID